MTIVFYFDTVGSVVAHSNPAPRYAVKAYERGFYPIHSARSASELNAPDMSPEVLESAQAASMFGWHVPAARAAVDYVQAREKAAALADPAATDYAHWDAKGRA